MNISIFNERSKMSDMKNAAENRRDTFYKNSVENKDVILVVDDVEANRIILETMLCEDYKIEQASNGIEALTMLLGGRCAPCVVLLDIRMPEMNGFEVLETMKQNESLKRIPVIFITAEGTEEAEIKGLSEGACDYITKPFTPQIVRLRVDNQVELYKYRSQLEVMVTKKANELTKVKDHMLETIANLIEHRNLESGEHVKRTSELTKIMLQLLIEDEVFYEELKNVDYNIITKAGTLHDVGKIMIPDDILTKPGKLTPEEFKIMETHTTIGSGIIDDALLYEEDETYKRYCHDICRHHHERWDGKGYPDGLGGTDIPISARIVSIVDVYDALVSARVYKPAFSHEKAISILSEDAGTKFDPDMIRILMKSPQLFHYPYM